MNDERNKFSPRAPKSRISPLQAVLLATAVVVGIPLVLLILFIYGIAHSSDDLDIAGPTKISSQWVELTPNPPLKPTRQDQYVLLKISPDLVNEYNGVKEPGFGKFPLPELEVIDQFGKTYPFYSDYYSTEMAFASKQLLPKDRLYRSVRIRCDRPIECAGVLWRNIDHK